MFRHLFVGVAAVLSLFAVGLPSLFAEHYREAIPTAVIMASVASAVPLVAPSPPIAANDQPGERPAIAPAPIGALTIQAPTATSSSSLSGLTYSGLVTQDELTQKLQALAASIQAEIHQPSPPASGGLANEISLTNRIDQLGNVTISNSRVNGLSGLTASDIPTLSYLPLSGGTIMGGFTMTNATSTNFFSANASTTNATSTNLFASNSFTLGNLTGFLKATAGLVATSLVNLTSDVSGILPITNGGTGWANINTGSILFGNGGSALATSSNLFWNNTNSRLGIGTSSPFATLSVQGNGLFSGNITAANITATGTLAVTGAVTPAIDLGIAGSTNTPQFRFETQANYAPFNFARAGSSFNGGAQGSTFDDAMSWGFNYLTGSKVVASAGMLGMQIESDYYNANTHDMELSLNYASPYGETATLTGAATNLDTLTLTISGGYTGSPQTVSVTVTTSETTTQMATALAAAVNANSTLVTAGFYATSATFGTSAANIVRISMDNPTLLANYAAGTTAFTSNVTGSATETITLATNATVASRPLAFGVDRDNGSSVAQYWNFGIGKGTGAFTIADPTLNIPYFNVDGNNPGYVSIGSANAGVASNLIFATNSSYPNIAVPHSQILLMQGADGANHIIFSLDNSGGYNPNSIYFGPALASNIGLSTTALGLHTDNTAAAANALNINLTAGNNTNAGAFSGGSIILTSGLSTNGRPGNFQFINGNVGVGTSTPYSRFTVWGPDAASSTLAFNVVSSASSTVFAVFDGGNAQLSGTLTQSSDIRLKTNIASLDASSSLAAIGNLNPVAFNWIDPSQGNGTQIGFIAQQVQQVFPELVSTTSATALTPDGTLGVNYIGLIAPLVKAVQALANEVNDLIAQVAGFSVSFTSQKITAQELCLGTTCIDQAQLATLLAQQGAISSNSGSNQNSEVSTSTPPTITINGDNPSYIVVGDSYADLGATITSPDADKNLGIRTFLNGTFVSNIVLDTSAVATDTIDYVANDNAGNTATSTRTVIVQAQSN